MTEYRGRFKTSKEGYSSALQHSSELDALEETDEEARAYDARIRDEIQWKLAPLGDGEKEETQHKSQLFGEEVEQEVPEERLPSSEATLLDESNMDPDLTTSEFIPPSFRPSHIAHSTPKPLTTSTFPSIPTPTFISTPLLPAGPSRPKITPRAIDTPLHVPSPIDTPNAEGRGRRDDPATPVPLGVEKFKYLKSKKDFQTLTKHFEVFTKQTERQKKLAEEPVKGKGKGKAKEVAALGGKVFEGLRFCFPPELGNTSKQKTHWDIIAKRGGQVTLQPDTAITHIIYESGRSAQILARQLGLHSLSELPEGTVCVRYDWVVHCLRAGSLVDTTKYLSFPKTIFSRSITSNLDRFGSRMTDITDLLRTNSVSISRKRGPTASDSETESPAKPVRHAIPPRSNLSRTSVPEIKKHKSDWAAPTVHTDHALHDGPGWIEGAANERDGLDDMISGLKNGSIPEEQTAQLQDEDEEGIERGSSPPPPPMYGNPSPMADRFKCGQAHDGAPPSPSTEGPNDWLAKKFDEMHEMYQGAQHKNSFQVRGYQKAAGVMRRTKWAITSGKDALKIKGIGQGMADRIDEWITGGPGRQDYETNEQVTAVQLFKDVYGVGRSRANEFYHKGARTIDDLKSGRFDLTEGQKIGLALYDDLKQRIPRDECKEIYDLVRAQAMAIDPKLAIEIMGSYRRGATTSGDVDFLITRDTSDGLDHSGVMRKLVQGLMKAGMITHELSSPHDWDALEAKWMGVCKLNPQGLHRRIDILCIPFEQWGAALLYFTGNDIFNRSLRLYARKKGYSLNQRGLYTGVIRGKDGLKLTEGEIIASRTEQEIFDVLGIRWRPPHHRRP